jgi:hypothetical protein
MELFAIPVSFDPSNRTGNTHSSEMKVAIREATPARIIVTLVSLFPVPPPDAPSAMTGKKVEMNSIREQPSKRRGDFCVDSTQIVEGLMHWL